MKQLWSVVLVTLLTLVYADAEAARLGGGRSAGRQSANVTQREAVRAPAQAPNGAQNAASSTSAAKSASTANTATRKPWAGMLGGLAAGLGLAWLASALGLGAEFGHFLLIALVVLVGLALVRILMRPRTAGTAASSPFAFQGAAPRLRRPNACRASTTPPRWATMRRRARGKIRAWPSMRPHRGAVPA